MQSVLERKLFDEEQQVSVKYLRGVLQLTRKELGKIANVDIASIRRAEELSGTLRYLTAARLVTTLNKELDRQGHLSEGKELEVHHVNMIVGA